MSNSTDSWDNSQKLFEADNLGGKNSDNHKAAIVGDTIKDTSEPSLNILIKLMSSLSVVAAGSIVRYSAVVMEILKRFSASNQPWFPPVDDHLSRILDCIKWSSVSLSHLTTNRTLSFSGFLAL